MSTSTVVGNAWRARAAPDVTEHHRVPSPNLGLNTDSTANPCLTHSSLNLNMKSSHRVTRNLNLDLVPHFVTRA